MAYKFLDPIIGADAPSVTGTVQLWPLGRKVEAVDDTLGMGEFVYVKGGANVAAGNLVVFRGLGVSQAATASQGSAGPAGIAYGPISASNVYGWVQVKGYASPVTISSAATSGDLCMVASTAGCIARTAANATTFANPIDGCIVGSSQSASSSAGVVYLNYPVIRGA